MVDSLKWNCERCKWERYHLLEEELQNASKEIVDLKVINKKLKEQLRVAATGNEIGRQSTVMEKHEGEQCLLVGDSIIRNVGTGQNNMKAECFPGIRTEQLHRVLDNRDLRTPDTVIIHVGTNDLNRYINLEYVMGKVYSLVDKAKVKFPKSKIVLSGFLWRTDVMVAHRSVKRKIRMYSRDIGSYICGSKQLARGLGFCQGRLKYKR